MCACVGLAPLAPGQGLVGGTGTLPCCASMQGKAPMAQMGVLEQSTHTLCFTGYRPTPLSTTTHTQAYHSLPPGLDAIASAV